MEALFLMGAVQALFFTVLILTKKKKSQADYVLSLWLFFLACHLIVPFFVFKDFPDNIHLAGVDLGLFISHSILLYLYACVLTGRKKGAKHYIVNTIILLFTNLLMLPVILLPEDVKVLFSQNARAIPLHFWLIIVIIYLESFYYLYLTLKLLGEYKLKIRNHYSNIEKINLNWLYNLTIGLLLFFILNIVAGLILYLLKTAPVHIDFATYTLLTALVYAIGYFGFKQGKVFAYDSDRNTNAGESKKASSPDQKREPGTAETAEEDRLFSQKILEFMEAQKPHLQNDLTLHNLAGLLNTTPHYTSFILNNCIGLTFYDFINSYRIKEVKEKITSGESKKYTLLSIAFDCGFNSKASFNRIFKKQTGITPSQYLKESIR